MMMRENRGISLIALIVTIVVIIILATIVLRVGTEGIDSSIEAKLANEKKELETAVIKRFADYSLSASAYPLIGSVVTLEELANVDGCNVTDIDYIRKVQSRDIQNLGVKNTTGKSYYVDYLAGSIFGPIE